MRVLFLGTPEFAVLPLKAIKESTHELVGVISQPDREKDKKGRLKKTPVHEFADESGLPCYQFEKIGEHADEIKSMRADVMVTAAYGQLLPQKVLDIAPHGIVNIHASLLPQYRGSSPIQTALLDGCKQTGITLMRTELSMDSGDILAQRATDVLPEDTAGVLSERLSRMGAEMIVELLDGMQDGKIKAEKQNSELATYCKKIGKQDGLIDWSHSAESIFNRIRAMNPWPVAYTFFCGKNIKIYAAQVLTVEGLPQNLQNFYVGCKDRRCGEIMTDGKRLAVICGEGLLDIVCLQAPGKNRLPAADFLRGFAMKSGDCFVGEAAICDNDGKKD